VHEANRVDQWRSSIDVIASRPGSGHPEQWLQARSAFGRPLRRVLRGAIARTRLTDDMLIIRAMETLDAQADRDAI
jgi:hypothetical protein